MDLEMPRLNGVQATAAISDSGCCRAIVIVSGSQSSGQLDAALQAGARWHVAKTNVMQQLPLVIAEIEEANAA